MLDQRAKFLRTLPILKDESQRYDIYDYGTRCIIVAGRTPSEQARRKSLELHRNAMSGVTLLTFDELLARLEEIYAALQPDAPAFPAPTPFEPPF